MSAHCGARGASSVWQDQANVGGLSHMRAVLIFAEELQNHHPGVSCRIGHSARPNAERLSMRRAGCCGRGGLGASYSGLTRACFPDHRQCGQSACLSHVPALQDRPRRAHACSAAELEANRALRWMAQRRCMRLHTQNMQVCCDTFQACG